MGGGSGRGRNRARAAAPHRGPTTTRAFDAPRGARRRSSSPSGRCCSPTTRQRRASRSPERPSFETCSREMTRRSRWTRANNAVPPTTRHRARTSPAQARSRRGVPPRPSALARLFLGARLPAARDATARDHPGRWAQDRERPSVARVRTAMSTGRSRMLENDDGAQHTPQRANLGQMAAPPSSSGASRERAVVQRSARAAPRPPPRVALDIATQGRVRKGRRRSPGQRRRAHRATATSNDARGPRRSGVLNATRHPCRPHAEMPRDQQAVRRRAAVDSTRLSDGASGRDGHPLGRRAPPARRGGRPRRFGGPRDRRRTLGHRAPPSAGGVGFAGHSAERLVGGAPAGRSACCR